MQNFVTENAIYIVLAVLLVGIAVYDPSFIGLNTLRDILIQSSTRVIIALGVAFILITGGTDLSAGRMVGLTAVVSASMLQEADYARRFFPNLPELPMFVPVLIAIAVGLLFGLINGVIVAKFKVPPFIATLGTMVAIYGINSLYFDTEPNQSQPIGGLRSDFTNLLGSGSIGKGDFSIPHIVIIAIVVCAIVWVMFNKTRLGKTCTPLAVMSKRLKCPGSTYPKT
ncbi:hypothetical protein HMSSN139_36810 [Paenibacillus sp. HMSSN-139]|nr:hypothetical protein HMSSN139_36810 [Paenibacillus sp. HMSSN-139]